MSETMTTRHPAIERVLTELDLDDRARDLLRPMARWYAAEAGASLLRKGSSTDELSVLASGRAVLTEQTPGRGRVGHLTLRTDDIFGWSSVVPPHKAASDVVALDPVEIVAFDATALRRAIDEDVAFSDTMHRLLVAALAERLVATRHMLLDLHGAGWAEPIYEPW